MSKVFEQSFGWHAPAAATEPDTCTGSIRSAGRLLSLRAIVFDAPGVLYDATLWPRWLGRLLGHMGLRLQHETFRSLWNSQRLRSVHCGHQEFDEVFEACLLESGLSAPQTREVAAASCAARRELEQQLRPFPGTRSALAQLRAARLQLLAFANTPLAAVQFRAQFASMGLADGLKQIIASREIGCALPATECLGLLSEQLGFAAGESALVSSRPAHLAAAHECGWVTIALNHPHDVLADCLLQRLDELPALILSTSHLAAAG